MVVASLQSGTTRDSRTHVAVSCQHAHKRDTALVTDAALRKGNVLRVGCIDQSFAKPFIQQRRHLL